MAYVNLAVVTKMHRADQIVADLGTSGLMKLYSGGIPASPDIPTTGMLLATLPLSPVAAVVSMGVKKAIISDPGNGGIDGSYGMTFDSETGDGAAGHFIITGGAIASAVISATGSGYEVAPTIGGFANAALTGGVLTPVMTAIIEFNPIMTATASGSGVIGLARFTTAADVPILDLDVGITNDFSVVTNNINIVEGGSVSCAAQVMIEL